MRNRWSRTLSLGCAVLVAATTLVGCDSDDDGSPAAATPSATVEPLPSSSPSAAPSFTSSPAPTPPSTPSAAPSATPSPVPSAPVGPFVLARETAPGGIAVGSDGTSWLVAYAASARVLGVRVGPLGVVLDASPVVLSALAEERQGEDPALPENEATFWAPAIAFDGAAYAVSFNGNRTFTSVTSEGIYELWTQRVSPSGHLLGTGELLEESNSQLFGGLAPRERTAMAGGAGEILTFYTQTICARRFSPHAPCPLRVSVNAQVLIDNGDGYDRGDRISLRSAPGPIPMAAIVPMSAPAAAWNGRATLAAWSEATVASALDGGFSEPMITGALLRDGAFDRLLVASGGDFAGVVAVAAHRGNFLVVWESEMQNEIRGRFIDSEGKTGRTGPASAITRGKVGALALGGVAATEDGFLVVWANGDELRAVRFDADGVQGGTFVLDAGPVGIDVAVAASESGYIVAFQRPNADLVGRYLPSAPR